MHVHLLQSDHLLTRHPVGTWIGDKHKFPSFVIISIYTDKLYHQLLRRNTTPSVVAVESTLLLD